MSDVKADPNAAPSSVADAVKAGYDKVMAERQRHSEALVDFTQLGVDALAYLKPTATEDGDVVAVYAANGDLIGNAESAGQAIKALNENGLRALFLN